jgi:hypothetical protein
MCGLVGLASTEKMRNRQDRKNLMEEGLAIDSFRGWDSTGIALVELDKEKYTPTVYKKDLHGFDFIQQWKVQKLLNDIERYSIVMGHNRSATRGTVSSYNAHPFQFDHITLVHNGTVDNCHDFAPWQECKLEVDSAKVAWAMARSKDEKEILEKCEGAFLFMWHNAKDGSLNIARNPRKNLHWVYLENENTMIWASEDSMLRHLLERRDLKVDMNFEILHPKPGIWYKFNIKDLRKFEKIPFVLSQGRRTQTTAPSHPYAASGYDQAEEWEAAHMAAIRGEGGSGTTTKTILTLPSKETSTSHSSGNDEIDEIRRSLSHQRQRDLKRAGVPTSKKRIERASAELAKLGFVFNQNSVFLPDVFVPYRNQRNGFGAIVGRLRSGVTAQLFNMTEDMYKKYHEYGKIWVKLVNVRNGPKDIVSVICVEDGRSQRLLANWEADKKEGSKSDAGSIERVYRGPTGTLVSVARFKELTDRGCGNCSGFVNPIFHHDVAWIGEPPTPICHECTSNPQICATLGIDVRAYTPRVQHHPRMH